MIVRLLLTTALLAATDSSHELLTDLPGIENIAADGIKIHTGYLDVSSTRHLHYLFVKSSHDSQNDPLLIWFNGGPGCSSLVGFLDEHGPYLLDSDGRTLRRNPYSWSKVASVVYLESPAGVGFSLINEAKVLYTDESVAQDNYAALKAFYSEFPEMRNNPLYLTGESYAGVYVPMLAAEILKKQNEFHIPLKGLAVGNPLLYYAEKNLDWMLRYAHAHGLLPHEMWNNLTRLCCRDKCTEICPLLSSNDFECVRQAVAITLFVMSNGLNPYITTESCNITKEDLRAEFDHTSRNKGQLPSLITHARGAPCLDDKAINSYLNQKAVREAMHIPAEAGNWSLCNSTVHAKYRKVRFDMAPLWNWIFENKVRVMLFFGENDMIANFMMGAQFTYELQLSVRNETLWKYNGRSAGLLTVYPGLIYLTIRGAGHTVPKTHGPQALYVITQFIHQRNFGERPPEWLTDDVDMNLKHNQSEKLSAFDSEIKNDAVKNTKLMARWCDFLSVLLFYYFSEIKL